MALRKPVDLAFFVIFLHRYVFELKFCEWNIRLTSHHWPRLSWYYGIKWLIWLVSCNSRALIYILLSLFVSTVRVWLLRLPPDRFWYHDSSSSRVLSSTFVTKPIIKTEIDFEKTQIPPPSPVKKKKKKNRYVWVKRHKDMIQLCHRMYVTLHTGPYVWILVQCIWWLELYCQLYCAVYLAKEACL